MNNSSNIFIDEIRVHFLTCYLCSTEYKRPKSLNCMHAFCQLCLEKYYEKHENVNLYRFLNYSKAITCPLCDTKTALPSGGIERLQNNFFLDNLNEVLDKSNDKTSKNYVCEICRNSKSKSSCELKAISRCLDCLKLLCRSCKNLHESTNVTKTHTVIDVSDLDEILCKDHHAEVAKFYCEQCERCICVMCTFDKHKNHNIITLDEALEINTFDLEEMLKSCSKKLLIYQDILSYLNRCQSEMRSIEDIVREESMTMVTAIRKGERSLISEMQGCMNDRAKHLLSNKDLIEMKLQKIEASYKITKVLLEKKDYELLKAKRDLKDQLSSVLTAEEFEDYFLLDKFVFPNKVSYVNDLLEYIYKNESLSEKFISLSEQDTKSNSQHKTDGQHNNIEFYGRYDIFENDDDEFINWCTVVKDEPYEILASKLDNGTQTQHLTLNKETMTSTKLFNDKNITTDIHSYMDKTTTTNDLITSDYYNRYGTLYDENMPLSAILLNKSLLQLENDDKLTTNNTRATAYIKNGATRNEIKIMPTKIEFTKPQAIIIKTSKILVK